MEQGGAAGGSHADGGRAKSKLKPTDRMSPLSIQTLSKIRKNASRRRLQSAARCTVHDNNSPGYEWLLPGWVAEERYMEHGRVYRYYYDPAGCMYKTRHEVLSSWARLGLIVLDD